MRPPGNWPKPAAAVRPDDPERPKSPSAVASRLGAATTSRDEGRKKLKSAAGKLREPEALKLIEDAQKFSDKLGADSALGQRITAEGARVMKKAAETRHRLWEFPEQDHAGALAELNALVDRAAEVRSWAGRMMRVARDFDVRVAGGLAGAKPAIAQATEALDGAVRRLSSLDGAVP